MAPMPSSAPRLAATSDGIRPGREDLEELLGVGITLDHAAGHTIVLEGDLRTHGFRVLTGALRLYKALPDGRRQVLDFLTAGDFFGLIGMDHYACSVETIVPSALARYLRTNLDAALRSKPELAVRLLELAETELERAHDQMLLLGRKSAEEKVAAFVTRFARRHGSRSCGRVLIRLPMSRQDMADYLGLTIETVSRMLTRLRQAGFITFGSPQDVILERLQELERLAHEAS